jgi:hypothetical protein
MKIVNPPVDPGQLPPHTDDFAFCNVGSEPVTGVQFTANGPEGSVQVSIPEVPPESCRVARVDMEDPASRIKGTHVICDAQVGETKYHFEFDETPEGLFVAQMICGVQDGVGGGVVPFGQVILFDALGQILTEALHISGLASSGQ